MGFNWNQYCRSSYSGNSDGCWFYNQDGWHTLDSVGVWATWMMRVLTSPYTYPTDIDDVSTYQHICVYPNPAQGKVTIECNENLAETAWLTDLTGRREQVRLTADGTGRYTLDLTATQTFKHSHINALTHSHIQAFLLTVITADGKLHTVRLLNE